MNTILIISIVLACLSLGSVIYEIAATILRIKKLKRRDANVTFRTKDGRTLTLGHKYDKKRTREFIDTMEQTLTH